LLNPEKNVCDPWMEDVYYNHLTQILYLSLYREQELQDIIMRINCIAFTYLLGQ